MTQDEAARLLALLTGDQKRLLIAADETVDGRVLIDAYPPHGLNAHMVYMYSMARDKLTPAGLAVRNALRARAAQLNLNDGEG